MIIGTTRAVVAEVVEVRPHPNAREIWLAYVHAGNWQDNVQVVYGGLGELRAGDLVPFAPPGARVLVKGDPTPKKIRARRYRGERSFGMLCSLRELGWLNDSADAVALLQNVSPGQLLDRIDQADRPLHVKDWIEEQWARSGIARPSQFAA